MGQTWFRQAALNRLSTPEQLDQAMRVTSPLGWLGLASLLGLLLAALAWSVVGTAPVKAPGAGILISPQGVLDVVSSTEGRITRLEAAPGDQVAREQVIARVDQPELTRELATRRAELAELEDRRERVRMFHEREGQIQAAVLSQRGDNLDEARAFLTERLSWLRQREGFETDMLAKGQISRQRHLDTKIEINGVREGLSRIENDLKELALEEDSQRIRRERELLDLGLKIESVRREAESLAERLEAQSVLRSPYAGRVVELKLNQGELLSRGVSLLSLLPDGESLAATEDELVAVVWVSPAEGKKVRPGMTVEVAPSTVRREEYGFMRGRVLRVAEIPSTAAGMLRILKNPRLVETLMGDGAPFQVLVRLERDPATPSGFRWSSSTGPAAPVESGTPCQATVVLREVRLISLVIPALEPMLGETGHGG
ncbi:MAG: NHLP bacteriocin system secretion protein [Alphaproteobacteria bacterium]|nr:NHLP bacteriocin system secretion protein [Alphaproteobacteria bacterium]MBF0374445.1 NHLP bacteriocin system secretion protein [Alphaproteobacteria bacterium]